VLSAVRYRSVLDYSVTVGTLFGLSVPDFWFGLMLDGRPATLPARPCLWRPRSGPIRGL